jgi:uncharacterized protein
MWGYLVLCALWSWPLQAAAIARPAWALPLLALGGIGPTLAATVVTRGAVWRSLREGPPLGLLGFALVGPLALVALAAAIDVVLGGTFVVGAPFIGAILLPPIGEELGWRGYLQPTLAREHGALVAALGVGVAWAVWHLAPAVMVGAPIDGLAWFGVSLVAWSIIFAWLLELGGGRVWLAVALHAGLNIAPMIGADSQRAALLRIGAVITVALFAATRLARRRARR